MLEIRLTSDWTTRLLQQPESGMGYQTVKVQFRGSDTLYGVVMNGTLLRVKDAEADDFDVDEIDDIKVL